MNKQAFLDAIRRQLNGLPRQEIEKQLAFYAEMIDDRIEDGLSEIDAVGQMGSVEQIVRQIRAEYPLSAAKTAPPPTAEKPKAVDPARGRRVWSTVLLWVGSPVWLSLLIAAVAVCLSLAITVWSLGIVAVAVAASLLIALWAVVVCLWAAALCLWVGLPWGLVMGIVSLCHGNPTGALAWLGGGIASAGAGLLFPRLCVSATKGMARLTLYFFHAMGGVLRAFGKFGSIFFKIQVSKREENA